MFCFKGRLSWYFFHESSSPKPLKIKLESFKIFMKIRRDICKSRYTTGINNTCGKFATGVSYTSGKFATGVNDNGGKLSHRYHWCCWYRWPICRGGRSQSTYSECSPPPRNRGGGGTLACGWGVGGSPNSDEWHTLWYSLYVRTLWLRETLVFYVYNPSAEAD